MSTKKRVATYRDPMDGTERCEQCGEITGTGSCHCNDAPISQTQRQKNAAMKSAGTKAKIRAACPSHTPAQQAERDKNAAAITRVWGKKVAGLMGLQTATCNQLRRWGKSAREEERKIKDLRAATQAPPSVIAAAERARPELESEFPMLQAFGVGKLRRAAAEHRHQEARESGRDFRQELTEQARFETAKSQLDSPSRAVQQLGLANLRRLQAGEGESREDLIASLKGSKVREYVTDQDLADCSMDSLRRLASSKDTLAGAGHTVGILKASAKQNRADRKRINR